MAKLRGQPASNQRCDFCFRQRSDIVAASPVGSEALVCSTPACRVAHRATATGYRPTGGTGRGLGGNGSGGGIGLGGVGGAGGGFGLGASPCCVLSKRPMLNVQRLTFNSESRHFTVATFRKLDKRAHSLRQNPNLFGRRNCECAGTR